MSSLFAMLTEREACAHAHAEDTGLDPVISQPAYRQILTAIEHAEGGPRASDLCRMLDAGTEPRHREGMRQRLKRLAARGILTEAEPGLFTMAQSSANR